jgi:5-formyltetrahydrofolate cyclo-ligase
MTPAIQVKQQIRAEAKRRIARLDRDHIQQSSKEARARLEANPDWKNASVILGYSATGHELDLWPALAAARARGGSIALPRYDSLSGTYGAALVPEELSNLTKAGFGILEPPLDAPAVPLNRLDFVMVPGLAFDPWGRRLGRGKGYYDRLLVQSSGIKCGVALDEQIVEEIPEEPHDIRMNLILTPTRWFVMPPAGS